MPKDHCGGRDHLPTVTDGARRILLMGNPNVGKSAVFSRLTGLQVISSNYPGTTVGFTQGSMSIGSERAFLIDVPGVYGLEATCKAEEVAIDMLRHADAVINVVDATNLERSLPLTLHLQELGTPLIVALNLWDEAGHRGVEIDVVRMERELGVPVIPTVGVTGEGIKELIQRLAQGAGKTGTDTGETKTCLYPFSERLMTNCTCGCACGWDEKSPVPPKVRTEPERWAEVGRIVNAVQTLSHRHHSFLEILGDASVRPIAGLFIALIVMLLSFGIIRLIGEGLIGGIFEPGFDALWRPLMESLSVHLGPGFWHSILLGDLVNGSIDFRQSFGMLTTGLFVAISMVFPYVLSFYLVLGFLEDFGYLPRLAVLLDRLMHRMGLHGWAIIPMLLGFGCNVPGIMATRVLESRRERLIASTLVCIAVPCASLQAMMWGILGHHGTPYVLGVYLALFVVWLILGPILNMIFKGESPELILEIPPYRLPSIRTVAQKLWMRMVSYFKEAVPFVMLGVLIVNILNYLHVFDVAANVTGPVVTRVFGLPREAVFAVIVGIFRKDVAVGMLAVLPLTAKQMVISVTVLSMSFPCVATFVVMARELGIRDMLKSMVIMMVTCLIVGGVMNLVL